VSIEETANRIMQGGQYFYNDQEMFNEICDRLEDGEEPEHIEMTLDPMYHISSEIN
jgi:hypothetical protein